MKTTLLKIGIHGFALLALCFAWMIRQDYSWQKKQILNPDIIYDTDIYGDLYQICMVNNFKISIGRRLPQYHFSDRHPDINEAKILTMGDSFFDHCREKAIPELLADSTGLSVYFSPHYFAPLIMLNKLGYQKGARKVILIEIVERYISVIDASSPSTKKTETPTGENHQPPEDSNAAPAVITSGLKKTMNYLFPPGQEKNYEFLLRRAKFSSDIYATLNTFQFNYLGYISSMTPAYSIDPPFLFYYESASPGTGSYYHTYSQEEIALIGANIKRLQDSLAEHYNLELVFFPIPDKISIYAHYTTNEPYSNFLPLLYRELENRGVSVVKVLEAFRSSNELLYYPTDTHWNAKGIDIALQKTMEKFRELNTIDPSE